jgi:DNA-binding MarR family transcriptional regulator
MSDATKDVRGSAALQPEPEAAVRVWAIMRDLVMNQEDRRKEITDTLGMSFFRVKALRRLLPGPLTMCELTARLQTEKPYTTLVVDDLEQRGYVERTVHPEDRRSKIVSLTPSGAAVARQAEGILSRLPHSLLALEPEELAALDRIMAKLRSSSA